MENTQTSPRAFVPGSADPPFFCRLFEVRITPRDHGAVCPNSRKTAVSARLKQGYSCSLDLYFYAVLSLSIRVQLRRGEGKALLDVRPPKFEILQGLRSAFQGFRVQSPAVKLELCR